jgi:hypothetical protein
MNGTRRTIAPIVLALHFCLVFPSRDPATSPVDPIPTLSLLEIVIVCFNLCTQVETTLYLIQVCQPLQ